MKPFSLFLFSVLFLSACSSYERPQYVTTNELLEESVYTENVVKIESLISTIESIPEIAADMQVECVKIDSLDFEDMLRLMLGEEQTYDSVPLTSVNSIIVNSRNNVGYRKTMNSHGSTNRLRADYTIGFMGPTSIMSGYLAPPFYWTMKENSEAKANRETENESYSSSDSITQHSVDRNLKNLMADIDRIDSVKYILTLADLRYKEAELVDDEFFEEGIIITQARIYDRMTKEKVFETILFTTSPEEIATMSMEGIPLQLQKATFKKTLANAIQKERLKGLVSDLGLQIIESRSNVYSNN